MPWKVIDPVSERIQFVSRLLAGERMTDVCRAFGVSRKTGYKLWRRYESEGLEAFEERSRRPLCVPHETPQDTVSRIVDLRRRHPTWGPKKLKKRLEELCPQVRIPAASTIGEILKREGLIVERRRRRRAKPTPCPLDSSSNPNELWAMDFKGHFRMGNRSYCYPLTVTDDYSRFLLGCVALESTRARGVQSALAQMFEAYGLPERMRSDNGSPFASTGRLGVTELSVWLLRLGIRLERIEPGHPEQNGRHERMHRTLKADCDTAMNLLAQQESFDAFKRVYNQERPHEALELNTPATAYEASHRVYPESLEPLSYPNHELVRRVYDNGHALLPGRHDKDFYVGAAFKQQRIGLRQLNETSWIVHFIDYELGILDLESAKLLDTHDQIRD